MLIHKTSNIKYSGVCHTDLHAVRGDWPLAAKYPLVGGHEGAGVVVARGELVKDVEIGDHAGIKVRKQYSKETEAYTNGYSIFSGSTALASPVVTASSLTSNYVPMLHFLDTLSMEVSKNMSSQMQLMSPVYPRRFLSML